MDHYSIQIMQSPDEADQVQRLLAFVAPVMSLQTGQERFEKYQETWTRLNPAAEKEVWKPNMAVNYPWSSGKVDLWRTLRRDIRAKFQKARNEHLNGEFTHRPVVDFSFMDYSNMLGELLDIYLKGLDKYIAIQDRISAVSKNMDAYDEDERPMSEKVMRSSRERRAKEFLDVILFMHAVPQRVDDKWDALDHESDVTWFREYCKVYHKNEELMSFLRDCAVVVLLVGNFQMPNDVQSILDSYKELERRV